MTPDLGGGQGWGEAYGQRGWSSVPEPVLQHTLTSDCPDHHRVVGVDLLARITLVLLHLLRSGLAASPDARPSGILAADMEAGFFLWTFPSTQRWPSSPDYEQFFGVVDADGNPKFELSGGVCG